MLCESKVSCMSHKQSIQVPMTTRILEYVTKYKLNIKAELEAAMVVGTLGGMSAMTC